MYSAKVHPVDKYTGLRLRARRLECGMTQDQLGNTAGVSFQQIQKYESGRNRISSSKLYNFSKALEVKIEYFFAGYEEWQNEPELYIAKDNLPVVTHLADQKDEYIVESAEKNVFILMRYFNKIKNPKIQKNIVNLIRSIADGDTIIREGNNHV